MFTIIGLIAVCIGGMVGFTDPLDEEYPIHYRVAGFSLMAIGVMLIMATL